MSKRIRILAMDVDGTLTDGKIYMGSQGEVFKAFNIKDGLGIRKLAENGIVPVIITGRKSEIVSRRAEELGITEVYQGIADKKEVLEKIADKYAADLAEIAYIGDDCNDLDVMQAAGITFAPADAAAEVLAYADVVVKCRGGEGAVREAADYLLKNR